MHGYKKTSISDIASSAGISKAMVFHYFGTKKELYVYLVNMCVGSISTEVVEKFDESITDLFDRIAYTSKLKMNLMKKHPYVSSFIQSAYFENDDEVKEELKTILAKVTAEPSERKWLLMVQIFQNSKMMLIQTLL